MAATGTVRSSEFLPRCELAAGFSMKGKCRSRFGEGAEVAAALQSCLKLDKQHLDFLRN